MDATAPDLPGLDETFMTMFRAEWRAQRGDAPLRTALIVDDDPNAQYLAPEFALARQMFGTMAWSLPWRTPALHWRDSQLWHGPPRPWT